jgi:mono/diheme cytochrome c family protein
VLDDQVRPGKYRHWSAVNLTGSKSGLGNWSAESIAQYLEHGECERAIVHGPMNEVVMNSTRYLTPADANAIAAYLKTLNARESRRSAPPGSKQLKAGEIAYTVHCGTCHLPTGSGDEILGIALANNAIVQASDPSSLINVILYGPRLPPPPFVVDRTRMKDFGKRLSDDEVADLASYVRASFGNHAGTVNSQDVRRQR